MMCLKLLILILLAILPPANVVDPVPVSPVDSAAPVPIVSVSTFEHTVEPPTAP